MAIQIVKRESTGYLTFSLFDKDDVLAVPTLLSYAVHEAEDGTVIRANTTLTPASSVEILLNAADNAILDATKDYEKHRVTVNAKYGADDELHDDYICKVSNVPKSEDAI